MKENIYNNCLKWSEEKCFEVAKQCRTKTEMKKRFCGAFEQANKHGWFVQYTWFRTTEIKWTHEACYELAKQCRSKTHFREISKGAYDAAKRHGWLVEYTWFNPDYSPNEVKWTEEACYDAAKQCGNVTEFREIYYGAYRRSKKYGWIGQYTWFQDGKRDIYKKVYTVYAYEDVLNKKVYIGLTNNIKRRIMEHKKKDYKHSFRTYDRVREYFENCDMETPDPIVLMDGIDGIEAQEKEGFYVEQYQNNGWDVINLSKTGKGLPSLGNVGVKWTYEACKEVAKSCRNRKEIEKKYSGVLYAIRQNGWTELLPPKKEFCAMTKEECIDFCKNINTMEDLKTINEAVYKRIKNKQWITVCFPRKTYTEEECREIAKQYYNFTEAGKVDKLFSYSVRKLGLTNLPYKQHENMKYTFEEARVLLSGYKNRTALFKNNNALYKFCKNNGWLDTLLPSKAFEWTLETAIEEAKKYSGRDAFRSAHHKVYDMIREYGLLDILFPKRKKPVYKPKKMHKKSIKPPKPVLSEIDCFNAASKCQYKREFREQYPQEYRVASKNRWLKKYMWLKGCKRETTYKDCVNAAKQCSTKAEFRENYFMEYTFARKTGILSTFTWLKRKKRTS